MESNIIPLGIAKARKPFSWSYSKLKNHETCPRRHEQIDILKRYKEDGADNVNLKWGKEFHDVMAKRLNHQETLPYSFKHFEPLVDRLLAVPGKRLVEQQLAITENFEKCDWFSTVAWFRSVADVLILQEPVALAIDWKTGKILEDYQQLALMAACIFAHYPSILAIRTEAWWVREDAITQQNFKKKDMQEVWRSIWPRVEQLKEAHETGVYPPKPGGLCRRYCPVTSCEFHGKGG